MTVDQVRTALRERIARGASLEEPRRANLRRIEGVRSLLGKSRGLARPARTR